MPTVAGSVDFCKIAEGCGYLGIHSVKTEKELADVLELIKNASELTFVEIKCAIGSRLDLGRPTKTPKENMVDLMNYLA